eukprot:GHRR01037316.1.p1 GENE.GHRR01037316.1~~GHRR01037316.1.p1  ORF type:complete len:105 (-),score=25.80 GHRR01037316.1:277-591(-)
MRRGSNERHFSKAPYRAPGTVQLGTEVYIALPGYVAVSLFLAMCSALTAQQALRCGKGLLFKDVHARGNVMNTSTPARSIQQLSFKVFAPVVGTLACSMPGMRS